MSKNPYEIRLETLKMAKEMLDQQWQMGERLWARWSNKLKKLKIMSLKHLKSMFQRCINQMKLLKKQMSFMTLSQRNSLQFN